MDGPFWYGLCWSTSKAHVDVVHVLHKLRLGQFFKYMGQSSVRGFVQYRHVLFIEAFFSGGFGQGQAWARTSPDLDAGARYGRGRTRPPA